MAGNITGWITVNGRHIPIMRGETKASATKRFLGTQSKKSKKTNTRTKTTKSKKTVKGVETKSKLKSRKAEAVSKAIRADDATYDRILSRSGRASANAWHNATKYDRNAHIDLIKRKYDKKINRKYTKKKK